MKQVAAAVFVFGALALAGSASGQGYLRPTFTVDRGGKQIVLNGRIANDATLDATGVRLRVVALDADGNAVTDTVAYIDRPVPARGEGTWQAKFPNNPAITSFRLVILGYDFRRDSSP
jgi:FlaG/FlaF family flagellin (archaellin)